MKKEISENWLVRLLDARLGHFAASEAPFPGEKYSTHGMLTRNERREILGTALEDVVFPGWEKAGFDVSKARAWAREKLPKPAMLAG